MRLTIRTIAIVIGLFFVVSCSTELPSGSAESPLTRLLQDQNVEDPLKGRKTVDRILYSDSIFQIYLRELAPKEVPAANGDGRFAYIHVFGDGQFICTIPVDVIIGE